jgi:hypothetical protein
MPPRCKNLLTNSFAVVVVQERQSRSDDIKRSDVKRYSIEQSFVGVQKLAKITQTLDILVAHKGDKSLNIRNLQLKTTIQRVPRLTL